MKSKTDRQARSKVFVWIEQVIVANLAALFPGMEISRPIPSTLPAMPM